MSSGHAALIDLCCAVQGEPDSAKLAAMLAPLWGQRAAFTAADV